MDLARCTLLSVGVCAPGTALDAIEVGESIWILAGQGPELVIYEHKFFPPCRLKKTVFSHQTIHGLSSRIKEQATHTVDYEIVIWGGKSLRIGLLNLPVSSKHDALQQQSLRLSHCVEAQDWILKAIPFRAATASTTTAVCLTTKNTIYQVTEGKADVPKDWYIRLEPLAYGPGSFLYACDIVQARTNHLIVASGTAFGEVLVWICIWDEDSEIWSTSSRQIYRSHQGSIFGVCISQILKHSNGQHRFLATCSDDRTIRLWDISDCDDINHNNFNSDLVSITTGFESSSITGNSPIAMVWCHISRIWGVKFLDSSPYEVEDKAYLLSHGEDATCQLWQISFRSSKKKLDVDQTLKLVSIDRYHSGKNIWSMTYSLNKGKLATFTGGADGRIVSSSRQLPFWDREALHYLETEFYNISLDGRSLKQYHILGPNAFLAISSNGEVVRGSVKNQGQISWCIISDTKTKPESFLCRNRYSNVIYVLNTTGLVTVQESDCNEIYRFSLSSTGPILNAFLAYENRLQDSLEFCLLVVTKEKSEVIIVWVDSNSGQLLVYELTLSLPMTFIVTSAAYDKATRLLVLGSRAGALAVYSDVRFETGTSSQPQCYRHLHGSDTVSSILFLPGHDVAKVADSLEFLHVMTTGRDGIIAVHRVGMPSDPSSVTTFHTVHSSFSSFGTHIEGAYLVSNRVHNHSYDILLYGFRSKDFVVWNERLDAPVLSIECGGAHRTWDFKLGSKGNAIFAWTKAGSFNMISKETEILICVQHGGHGREIKSLTQSPVSYYEPQLLSIQHNLVATGAEDTTIRLFAVSHPSNDQVGKVDSFQSIRTLRKHTTGIQHLSFSSCGTFLFSSAGCEEFFVWKLWQNVPCFRIGVCLYDVMPTCDYDEDARITNFDIVTQISDETELLKNRKFTIIMAYSNGKAKILSYQPGDSPRRGKFETIHELSYGSFCLTQIELLEPSQLGNLQIISAGTNGYLNIHSLGDSTTLGSTQVQAPEVYHIHKSTVMTMKGLKLSQKVWLIVTGGDDNAMALTFVQLVPSSPAFTTLLIPKAHAAALTALDIIDVTYEQDSVRVLVVSCGNDQKVKIWKIQCATAEIDSSSSEALPSRPNLADVHVEKIVESWTAVADVSDVCHLRNIERSARTDKTEPLCVVVVGVGMEILRLSASN